MRFLSTTTSILALLVLAGELSAQRVINNTPNWTVITSPFLPEPSTCLITTVGNMYIQTQNPNNGPTRVLYCTQAGPALFQWQPIGYSTVLALPAKCATGQMAFLIGASPPGENLYGCTATDTWTLQSGGGGSGGGGGNTINVNGVPCVLGSSCTVADATKVPTTRTVNSHALTGNVVLTSTDVGAVPPTTTVNGHPLSGNVSVTASDVGLGSVNNTADTAKPVSTAQQTALNLKANLSGAAFTGPVTGITPTMVGLGTVTNDTQTKAAIVPNTAPSAGQILVGNAGGTAYAPVSVSGSCTMTQAGVMTCSGSGGGTIIVNGVSCTTGSSCTVADATKVPTTVTVNGHALSGNVSVTGSDVGLGALTNNVQTQAAIVPNTPPAAGQILIGQPGGTYLKQAVSGSCTMTQAGVMTCSGSGGGTIIVNGVSCTTGSSCTVADSTKVPTTITVNGHALSSNVTVSSSDVGIPFGTGALMVTSGVPGLVSGLSSDCVKVDGSSGACATGSGVLADFAPTKTSISVITVAGGSFLYGTNFARLTGPFTFTLQRVSITSITAGATTTIHVSPAMTNLQSGQALNVQLLGTGPGCPAGVGVFIASFLSTTSFTIPANTSAGCTGVSGVVGAQTGGTAIIFTNTAGQLEMSHSAAMGALVSVTGSGGVVSQTSTGIFPNGSIPIATVSITTGDFNTVTDYRAVLSAQQVQSGPGIDVTMVGGQAQVATATNIPRLDAPSAWLNSVVMKDATKTLPWRTGAGSPNARDNCVNVGEAYFQTDTPGLWTCTIPGTPGTWLAVGSGGGGGGGSGSGNRMTYNSVPMAYNTVVMTFN